MKLLFRRDVESRNDRSEEELAASNKVVLVRRSKVKLELTITTEKLNADGAMERVRQTLELDMSALFKRRSYVWVYIDHFGEPFAVDAMELLNAQDGPAKLAASYPTLTNLQYGPTLAICFGDDLDKSAVIFNRQLVFDGMVTKVVGKHLTDILADEYGRQYPWMTEFRDKWKAKSKLKVKIDPLDSLSALEKQVDFLTGLVRELLPELPEEQNDVINQYLASTAVKTHADLEESIAIKRGLRDIVSAYKASK